VIIDFLSSILYLLFYVFKVLKPMHPILFKIGPLTIYTYGFFVFLGVLSGYLVCLKLAVKEDINKTVFSDIIFWTLIFSFLGARIFYIFVDSDEFLAHPFQILIGRSGFVFYGGVIFGLISSYFLAKRNKINFLQFCDIVGVGIPLAHAFGRIGCFSYGCCYGQPTTSWIGVLFPPDSPAGFLGAKVIPTQLIEALFLFILFFILKYLNTHKKFNGEIVSLYLVFYGIFRFCIEFFRGDPRGNIFFLSVSQFVSIILVVVGIFLWVKQGKKIVRR